VPLIETTSGRTILLRGLTARVRDASGPTWVDLAIQAINSRVANRRG
jgi:hypothetical protein